MAQNLNAVFCRMLHTRVMVDVKQVTTSTERDAAWAYNFGGGHWEFHGPKGFYWHGEADNAYDARAKGWGAYLKENNYVA